jgi:dUTP pyrophosphatase
MSNKIHPAHNYLPFKKLHPDAKIIQPRPGDAGYDLCCVEDVWLETIGEKYEDDRPSLVKIDTHIAIEIPKGYVGLIRDKSSIGGKGIVVCGGVLDEKYRGNIIICLANTTNMPYNFRKGDKIAQLLIVPYVTPQLIEVDELEQTERGDKGFGSTGR